MVKAVSVASKVVHASRIKLGKETLNKGRESQVMRTPPTFMRYIALPVSNARRLGYHRAEHRNVNNQSESVTRGLWDDEKAR